MLLRIFYRWLERLVPHYCWSRSGEARINHMPIRPIIARVTDAHLPARLRRRGDWLGSWFGRLKAPGDGLRVRSQ